MNDFSNKKIEELNAIPLRDSKEWKKSLSRLNGRDIYWEWKQKCYTIKYICPITLRVWFTETFNGWSDNTNAIDEMYLIPIK